MNCQQCSYNLMVGNRSLKFVEKKRVICAGNFACSSLLKDVVDALPYVDPARGRYMKKYMRPVLHERFNISCMHADLCISCRTNANCEVAGTLE